MGLGAFCASSAAVARPAAAFQVVPADDYARLIDHSCGGSDIHRRLLEEAEARLGVTLTQAQRSQALAAMKCPICGCPLVTAEATPDTPAPAVP